MCPSLQPFSPVTYTTGGGRLAFFRDPVPFMSIHDKDVRLPHRSPAAMHPTQPNRYGGTPRVGGRPPESESSLARGGFMFILFHSYAEFCMSWRHGLPWGGGSRDGWVTYGAGWDGWKSRCVIGKISHRARACVSALTCMGSPGRVCALGGVTVWAIALLLKVAYLLCGLQCSHSEIRLKNLWPKWLLWPVNE